MEDKRRKGFRNKPLEAQYQEVAPGIAHLEHAEVLRGYQEASLVFHPISDESFYFPCCLELHEGCSLDRSTHNTRVVASYPQVLSQVLLQSVQMINAKTMKIKICTRLIHITQIQSDILIINKENMMTIKNIKTTS